MTDSLRDKTKGAIQSAAVECDPVFETIYDGEYQKMADAALNEIINELVIWGEHQAAAVLRHRCKT